MARTGRPKVQIDEEQFKALCRLHCTLIEIAGFFHCSEDTIENWCKRTFKMNFSDVFKRESAPGKMSLRRTQFRMAEHSVPMAIWLGKQYLGQREVIEQTGDDASMDVLNEIATEIRKAKEYARAEQAGSNTISD